MGALVNTNGAIRLSPRLPTSKGLSYQLDEIRPQPADSQKGPKPTGTIPNDPIVIVMTEAFSALA